VGQFVLKRQQDSHFYANVLVEDNESRSRVDTGASIVALTGEDAQAMGLFWDQSSVQRIGSGASGAVYAFR
jgi:aspartyl protease family protein